MTALTMPWSETTHSTPLLQRHWGHVTAHFGRKFVDIQCFEVMMRASGNREHGQARSAKSD
jgi:hypothetical protein